MITKVRFKFQLKHTLQGDICIPIDSLSARIRSGSPSYLQVTIPDYDTYLAAVSARATNGKMYLYKSVDKGAWALVMWVNLENIYSDRGPVNKSITLSGHRTFSNSSPQTITLSDYTYAYNRGSNGVRCSVYNTVNPGDTIIYGASSFVVDLVTLNVSTSMTLELKEA